MSWKVDAQAFRCICTQAFRSHTAAGRDKGRALQRGEDVGLLRMAMSAQPSLARAGAWEGGGRHQTHPRQAGSTRTRPVSIGWKRCDCCVRVSQLRWVHSVPPQGGENPQEQEGKALNLPPSSQAQAQAQTQTQTQIRTRTRTPETPAPLFGGVWLGLVLRPAVPTDRQGRRWD